MKIIYILLLFTSLFANDKEVIISGNKYKISQTNYELYGEKGVSLSFLTFKSKVPVLSFDIENRTGECGKRDYKESVFKIIGDNIIIFTKWRGYNVNGYRKMIYHFNKNATVDLTLSKLFILDRSDEDSLEYIHKIQDGANIKSFISYIKSMESEYRGDFVYKNERRILKSEVDKAFEDDIKKRWSGR